MNRADIYGHLAALFCILVWGITFISTKILLANFTPVEILVYRFFIGWVILWFLTPGQNNFLPISCQVLLAGAGCSGVTLYFLLENIALKLTLASNVGIIVSLAPFFTGILAWKFLSNEIPTGNFFAGFCISFFGMVLISYSGLDFNSNPSGDVLALLAAFSWAIYSIFIKKLGKYKLGTLRATRGIFFWGLIFMSPLIFDNNFSLDWAQIIKPINLFNLLFLGILASALCFAAWTLAVNNLGAIKTSVYIYLVPVITVLAAAIILDEPFTLFTVTGVILTVAGLLISEKKGPTPKNDR